MGGAAAGGDAGVVVSCKNLQPVPNGHEAPMLMYLFKEAGEKSGSCNLKFASKIDTQ